MPHVFRCQLAGPAPQNPYQHTAGLRALLLRWIAGNDEDLAESLHASNRPKPYSIGPLVIADDNILEFDVSVLSDDITWSILRGIERLGPKVRLGRFGYMMTGPVSYVHEQSWDELLQAQVRRSWRFALMSPVAHHAKGSLRKAVVLPDPVNYFGSWLSRWNLYGPAAISSAVLDVASDQIVVSHCAGATHRIAIERGRSFIGFVGEVTFDLLKPECVDVDSLLALGRLAALAPFSGTGVETMRGMGLTRPIVIRKDDDCGE